MNKMKNLEINKNAVKKLSMAALITSSLMLGGCGSSNTDKPKDEPTVDVKKENDGKVLVKEMSVAETKKLAEGEFVGRINENTLKLPNREVLESMGLDYEVEFESHVWSADDKEKDKSSFKNYMYDYTYINLKESEFEYESTKRKRIDIILGVKIAPIIYVGKSGASDDIIKVVQLTEIMYETKLLNPENYELLEKMILEKLAFTDKTEKTKGYYL